jgi:hypothetical protein
LVWGSAAALVLGCSATPEGDTDRISNGGTLGPTASPECVYEPSRCDGCVGCLARCLCLTENSAECPIACGDGNGQPPPPPGAGGTSGGLPPDPPPGTGGASTKPPSDPPPPQTGGTTGASPCTYPPGPYGTKVGDTVSPNHSWQGFLENSSSAKAATPAEYFDCDGSRGVHAVLLVQSATWCGACKTEAAKYNSKMANGWKQKGIRILTLMIENAYGQPATLSTAQGWRDSYSNGSWSVVADPDFTFRTSGSNGLPTTLILDPRTMKIIHRQEGGASTSKLEGLALSNASN